jgi:hypothetical protein
MVSFKTQVPTGKYVGWGPRAILDVVAKKEKNSLWESNPGHPAHGLVTMTEPVVNIKHKIQK